MPNANRPLGPWEPTLSGQKPQEELTKQVADWLYIYVLNHPALGEMQSRGIQFEVEAKLGILVDRDTNHRLRLPVASECILDNDLQGVAFKSTMTPVRFPGRKPPCVAVSG